ncbi:lipopolysaccharide biosynthesis protein [Halorubellus sp. JP-L1]|uniref:lipopolysaccharide biosynthesis protein n=1 Tax=Halorubellus sp. JP-L1 TaxID=2715753 RepID=UPI00140E90AA|nr:lipopolysaccharide biosynthesis protein [Halorubellus sp. JP-L1]NHN40663.1 lipopolysaccharide biosynthesis protein [Halorubellus sp. JP-L1]
MTADATDDEPAAPSSPDPRDDGDDERAAIVSDGDDERAATVSDGDVEAPTDALVESRLEDALERVAHGATVSVPGILAERGLSVAFTAVLTNGLGASAYGVFALARRSQSYLLHLAFGFKSGLSRFLPNAADDAERDALIAFASVLLLAVSVLFGAVLYVAAPTVAGLVDVGRPGQFETLLRVFAVGMPAMTWLFAVGEVMRGLEAVGPLTLTMRVGFPLAQLAVGGVGVLVFDDAVLVAVGVVAAYGVVGVGAMAWLARDRGIRPRLRGPDVRALWHRYVAYTLPLFVGGFATVTQRLGFYPLIAWFLTGLAGGVFAVGVLVGSLVRLPLMAINQFIPPVAAELNESGHARALSRLYHVTSRMVLVGVTGLSVPVVVYRRDVMAVFGDAFVPYADLLAGFVVAQYVACAAGSVGILLAMTDNQRALLVVNTAITAALVVVAIPLTAEFGLPGLVGTYVLMLTLNNALEVVVLYHLEGLQPLTRRHGYTLVAATPLAAAAVGARELLPGAAGIAVGVLVGVAAYAATLRWFGFTPVERRLVGTLADRYRGALDGIVVR